MDALNYHCESEDVFRRMSIPHMLPIVTANEKITTRC